jgi:LCP family protein required for cell wall assembly
MRNPFARKKKGTSDLSGVILSVRTRERKRLAWLRKKWVWIPLVILIVLGGIAGYGLWYYYSLQGDIQIEIAPVEPPKDEKQPFNALLVGSDSRAGLTEEEQVDLGAEAETSAGVTVTGERADTLIVAHVDPESNRVTMVQFPRDLYVALAAGGHGKINSALTSSKADLVSTVENLTGLNINVYAQVNIAGFRDLVDAIDGVDVCIPEPIPFDPATGIEVTPEQVGMVHFDGDRALRFVRSRKVFGEGDFARIQNQQKFLSAAVTKITSLRTFVSFTKLLDIKRAAGKNLKIDSNTDLRELYRLMQRFRSFDPDHYEAYTAPNLGVSENEAGSVVIPDEPTMHAMFDAIIHNESPMTANTAPAGVDPGDIVIGVFNGANHDKVIAAPAAEQLTKATEIADRRIDVVEVSNADRDGLPKTIVRYEDGDQKKAQLIAAAIPGAVVRRADIEGGLDVEVVVGKHFQTKKLLRITPIELPVPGDLPEACRE